MKETQHLDWIGNYEDDKMLANASGDAGLLARGYLRVHKEESKTYWGRSLYIYAKPR